jgi:hypothetical protein
MKTLSGRDRNLAILGGATILFGVLAGLALFQRAQEAAPQFTPEPLFPGLTARINDLGAVTITTKDGSVEARATDQGWVLPAKTNFPADFAVVRQMAVGVASLEVLEPRTANPELHARLGLVAPDSGGDAVRIALADRNGQPMADVLVSPTPQQQQPDGRNTLYVRRAAENESWLARGTLTPRTQPADWLAKNIVPLTRDRIQSVTVTPANGAAYTVSRSVKEEVDFLLANMPAQRELSYPGAANSVALAAMDFEFDDVAPAADVDFARAAQHATKTFDGLTLTIRIAQKGEERWAAVTAQADNAEKQAEAATINARLAGRAFKLPEFEASLLTTTRDSMIKPIGGGTVLPTAP